MMAIPYGSSLWKLQKKVSTDMQENYLQFVGIKSFINNFETMATSKCNASLVQGVFRTMQRKPCAGRI